MIETKITCDYCKGEVKKTSPYPNTTAFWQCSPVMAAAEQMMFAVHHPREPEEHICSGCYNEMRNDYKVKIGFIKKTDLGN